MSKSRPRTTETTKAADVIVDDHELVALCKRLADARRFAFDTEFVSEDNYQPEVCLIQVATTDEVVLIDPLTGVNTQPFWELLADDRIEVIVHAGMEDLTISFQQTGQPPSQVFDVQIAAGLIGFDYPLSLMRLIRQALGIRLHKSQTLTDWRIRPLRPEQLLYATEDVAHLSSLYDAIHRKLQKLGRVEWADEEMLRFSRASAYETRSTQKLTKLKGKGSLKRQGLAIAGALLEARDELAAQYNRPPRSILKDHLLIEIAQHAWTRVDQIKRLRGLNLRAEGLQRLADAVKHARAQPEESWPQPAAHNEDTFEEIALTSLITAFLQDFAHRNGVAYQLLAVKQDVRALIRSHQRKIPIHNNNPLTKGWRAEAVGALIEDILKGHSAIRINPDNGAFQIEP